MMARALEEARAARAAGDFPVGAVLVVGGVAWGSARNGLFSTGQTTAHAESRLLDHFSQRLRAYVRNSGGTDVTLYTTLEPCLMCFGMAVLHRVSRIVIACPDPDGGATRLDPSHLGQAYARAWPAIQMGLECHTSRALVLNFLHTGKFRSAGAMLAAFEAERRT